MRLIASPFLTEQDREAILRGYRDRDQVIEQALLKQLDVERWVGQGHKERLECLSWLVATDRLDVRIAVPRQTRDLGGIYHEKAGVFTDDTGDRVAFVGSSNETAGGLLTNFESIDVFCSWDDPHGRVSLKVQNFERLWNNQTDNLDVLPFPKAARDLLVSVAPQTPPEADSERLANTQVRAVKLRDYQREAVDAWFNANCRGIMAMATGSGKTITSLVAVRRLQQMRGRLFSLITCPYQHLIDQWDGECRRFGMLPILAYQSKATWEQPLQKRVLEYNLRARESVVVLVTHSSLISPSFKHLVEKVQQEALFVADEVHHLGAPEFSSGLVQSFGFRLGLSATPERWMDEEGTARIHSYFGNTVYEYPLNRAIKEGRLTPYHYYPCLVPLTAEEMRDYSVLSVRIGQIYAQERRNRQQQASLEALLRRRAMILNRARNKIEVLRDLLADLPALTHSLFYCAPGQVDEVLELLGTEIGMIVHPFTAKEDAATRQVLLADFAAGLVQGLVAMRCLDEGVDVPATRTAFILASSSNPREFIQRRGRILRLAEGKDQAVIYDLIAVPPEDVDEVLFNAERSIVRRELARFREFASSAENRFAAEKVIGQLARRYHLMDM